MDWLNSEMYALLAIKTADTATAGDAWNGTREVTIDIVWRFSRNR